ncbi:MAG: hypothetical protein LBC82_00255 [Oscillospiraceae bacterium]|jgi:hypothetical protein|nr:hypothetical protein [Oscillospiraceae bacterium]
MAYDVKKGGFSDVQKNGWIMLFKLLQVLRMLLQVLLQVPRTPVSASRTALPSDYYNSGATKRCEK